jgi:surface antigen
MSERGPIVRLSAVPLALALLAVSTGDAGAVAPSLSFELAWPGLSQDDLDRMHAAAARLYEGRSIGTVERWRNPDTKDAGVVKLLKSFEAHGMSCRTIDYTIRFESRRDRPNHYVLNWCKQPDGTWKIVELAPPG